MKSFVLAAAIVIAAPASADDPATTSAAAYRARISWMEAQQLAGQQTELQAACAAARTAGATLPAGC